jgi:hypothetical protein
LFFLYFCFQYWEAIAKEKGEEEAQRRIDKSSKHRSLFKAPSTPTGFWEIDFCDSVPETQESPPRKISRKKLFSKKH